MKRSRLEGNVSGYSGESIVSGANSLLGSTIPSLVSYLPASSLNSLSELPTKTHRLILCRNFIIDLDLVIHSL